jgi:Flp pilus assembly protein TadG
MRVRSLNRHRRRRGGNLVEAAIVLPVFFMFMAAMVYIGFGVFRYQQVAELAREGARYASVHGTDYATDTGHAAATKDDVYNKAIKPAAVGLDLGSISYDVTWNTSNAPTHNNASGTPITNTVSVTVTYTWTTYLFAWPVLGAGPLTLSSSSTSVMPMAY